MILTNQFSYIKRLVYQLEREYGTSVDIYHLNTSVSDTKTGKKSITKTKYPVRRAIVLSGNLQRKFAYDRSYISANRAFTYGGYFDVGDITIIIRRMFLPKDFNIDLDDYSIVDHKKYDIKSVNNIPGAILLTLKEVEGAQRDEIFETTTMNKIIIVHQATINTILHLNITSRLILNSILIHDQS